MQSTCSRCIECVIQCRLCWYCWISVNIHAEQVFQGLNTQKASEHTMGWPLHKYVSGSDTTCRFKFMEGFKFQKGGKLPGLCGGLCDTGCQPSNGLTGWSARHMWIQCAFWTLNVWLHCCLPILILNPWHHFDNGVYSMSLFQLCVRIIYTSCLCCNIVGGIHLNPLESDVVPGWGCALSVAEWTFVSQSMVHKSLVVQS